MTAYNISEIRKLVASALDDSALQDVCFDQFRPVYDNFTSGQDRSARIRKLVEHADSQGKIPDLLKEISAINPKTYETFKTNNPSIVNYFCESQSIKSSQSIPSNSLYIPNNLPRSGVVDFCGRQDVQRQIHEQLSDEKSPFKTLAIVGMGGIGKTEVVLQYAREYLDSYSGGICWIYSKNQEDIAGQIIKFAQIYLQMNPSNDLSSEEQLKFCWNYWPRENSLIIFDNVSNYESIRVYLPPNEPRFRVLITSRSLLGGSIKHKPLNILDEAAAIAILKSFAGEERIEGELIIAKEVCTWLGYLPLGLELVGRYLGRRSDLSLMVLQQRLEDKRLSARAISHIPQAERDMARPGSISATFELSWAELSKEAKFLAYGLSLFASSPIPWDLVQHCFASWDVEELEDLREESLVSSHLLNSNGNNEFQLHQLVREFFREKDHEIDKANEIDKAIANGLSLLAKAVPESLTQEILLPLGSRIPHFIEVTAGLLSQVDDSYFTESFQGIGRYFEGQGFTDKQKKITTNVLISPNNDLVIGIFIQLTAWVT
jgi:hypothetical protein